MGDGQRLSHADGLTSVGGGLVSLGGGGLVSLGDGGSVVGGGVVVGGGGDDPPSGGGVVGGGPTWCGCGGFAGGGGVVSTSTGAGAPVPVDPPVGASLLVGSGLGSGLGSRLWIGLSLGYASTLSKLGPEGGAMSLYSHAPRTTTMAAQRNALQDVADAVLVHRAL